MANFEQYNAALSGRVIEKSAPTVLHMRTEDVVLVPLKPDWLAHAIAAGWTCNDRGAFVTQSAMQDFAAAVNSGRHQDLPRCARNKPQAAYSQGRHMLTLRSKANDDGHRIELDVYDRKDDKVGAVGQIRELDDKYNTIGSANVSIFIDPVNRQQTALGKITAKIKNDDGKYVTVLTAIAREGRYGPYCFGNSAIAFAANGQAVQSEKHDTNFSVPFAEQSGIEILDNGEKPNKNNDNALAATPSP